MPAFRMNLRWLTVASLVSAGCFVSLAQGDDQEKLEQPRVRALRTLEIERLRLKLYERVDYPLRQRQLQTDIKLTEARIASLRRRIKEVDGFYGSAALFTMLEDLKLDLLEAELLLKDSKHELALLQLHHRDERRLRQLLIEDLQQQAR